MGVLVVLGLLPHAGVKINTPHNTTSDSMSAAPRAPFPVAAAPMPASPRSGKASQRPNAPLRTSYGPFVTGPNVLMLMVEVVEDVPFTVRFVPFGLNEHTGAIVTSGLIEAHERVIPVWAGVKYPYTGFTSTVPWAVLPAGTLVGATALVTLMVNCGDTARTVSGSAGVVKEVVGPVPVNVML